MHPKSVFSLHGIEDALSSGGPLTLIGKGASSGAETVNLDCFELAVGGEVAEKNLRGGGELANLLRECLSA